MKKVFIFLIVLSFPCFSYAQSVRVSEAISLKSDEGFAIIGKMKGRYLLYKLTFDGKSEIKGFDKAMNLKWTKELELDDKRAKVLDVTSMKNNFTLIYKYKEKGNIILKAQKYDPGANLIDSLTIDISKNSISSPNFEIIASEDNSKLLIYKIENQKKISAISFDVKTFKVLWTCSFSLEDLAFYRDFSQFLISDSGRMYFIVGKNNRKSKREDHGYDIYICDEKTTADNMSVFSFSMMDKLTFDIVFNYDNLNNTMVAGGLYAEKTKAKADGYFYLNIDPKHPDDHKLTFKAFDDEFVSNYLGKQIEASKGLSETVIQEIILRRDGGILMVGEQEDINERQSPGVGGMNSGHLSYDYYNDDLFVISIHPDGETHWKTVLHKRQYSYDDEGAYSSYFLLKTASSLRFIFNDEIKYENTVSEYVLKGDGNHDRNSVLNTKNKKLRLMFRHSLQVGASELIVPSEFRNKLRLVALKF